MGKILPVFLGLFLLIIYFTFLPRENNKASAEIANHIVISQVSISTLNGSVIYSGTLQEGHNSIDMSQFSDGLYILYVNNKPYRIVKMN